MKPLFVLAAIMAAALYPGRALAAAEPSLTDRPLSIVLLLAALSLLPFVMIMITCYVRISVVLYILRLALGTPQIPQSMVISGIAIILTMYVMAPTGARVYDEIKPSLTGRTGAGLFSPAGIGELQEAGQRAVGPIREFLTSHSAPAERRMFREMALRMWPPEERPEIGEGDLMVVVPAFVITELMTAFKIGFLLFLPFLVIDLVVANVLLALGMHMLSPTTISIPFKLLLFIMVDGWHLLTRGLLLSYS